MGLADEHVEAAEAAGLRYVTDNAPGIRRRRRGRGFAYTRPDGAAVRDPAELERIRKLVIPPRWTDVWICTSSSGHLQVTARDARGRKQYRYHARYRAVRDDTKFSRLVDFSDVLPRIRQRVEKDISAPTLSREKVLATVVWLLEKTLIRVGSDEYARDNGSFGLTTLRRRHVAVSGAKLRFEFRGKSGVPHAVAFTDRRILASITAGMSRAPAMSREATACRTVSAGSVPASSAARIVRYSHRAVGEPRPPSVMPQVSSSADCTTGRNRSAS